VKIQGCGLGLRQELTDALCRQPKLDGVDFIELAPENWIEVGGRKRDQLDRIAATYPLVAHGLSLSIAGTHPLNRPFLTKIRRFLDEYRIDLYSDHLSLSHDDQGYLYDLLPTPRYRENIAYLSDRIKHVQDATARQLVLENISYYHSYPDQMPEGDFIAAVIEKSGCGVLLDINNAYVNGHNHDADSMEVANSVPSSAVIYYHIAGHLVQPGDFILDTHGMPVADGVMRLGQRIWALHGPRPLLLERDHNVPSLSELCLELGEIHSAVASPVYAAACHSPGSP
jgi:uncharacterized protein